MKTAAALTELFQQVKNAKTPVVVERVVGDIDEIVRLVRFPRVAANGCRQARNEEGAAGGPANVQLHQNSELFEKAYGYSRLYY